MKRTRITDNIEYIEPTGIPGNNSSSALAISASPGIVIDLNLSEEDTESILRELQPEQAYATHFHYDHSRFWQQVERYSSAEFYIPEEEVLMINSTEAFMQSTFAHYGTREIREVFFEMADFKEIKNYSVFGDGHRIRAGSSTLESVLTPGHSLAHMSFYLPAERALFTGDLGLDRFGPWYGWVSCELEPYIESILKLKAYDVETLLTSHEGIISTDIEDAWDRCLHHFFTRERSILEQLEAGKTEEEIVAKGIFFTNKDRVKEPKRSVITLWDQIMLMHHQKILEKDSLENRFPELAATLARKFPLDVN